MTPEEQIRIKIAEARGSKNIRHVTLTGIDEPLITTQLPNYSRQIDVIQSNGTITLS